LTRAPRSSPRRGRSWRSGRPATVNVSLVAAKQELTKLTAEQEKLLDASKQADAAQAKANGDVAAMEKLIAEGPGARRRDDRARGGRRVTALRSRRNRRSCLSAALAERHGVVAAQSTDLLAKLRDAARPIPGHAALTAPPRPSHRNRSPYYFSRA
jgi:hypothetical protein